MTVAGRPITLTAATNTKVYDGTTNAAGTPLITSGSLAPGDAATLSEAYSNKSAGTGKSLVPTATFTSGSASNYAISLVNNNTGVITTRAITVTAATNTKTFDGTTSAAAIPSISSGILAPGDTNGFTETYDTPAAGTGKTMTPSGAVNDGNGGANYAVTTVTDSTGAINTRAITITAVTNTKNFDGTTSASATPTLTGTLATGDAATRTETYATITVGSGKTLVPAITFTSGSPSNYAVTLVNNTTGVINPRAITVTAATNSKAYDGTTSAAATPTITVGSLAAGDAATLSEAYTTSTIATGKTLVPAINFTSGSASNYSITLTNTNTGVITTRAITVTAMTDTKGYDGTTSSTATPTITSGSLAPGDAAILTETFANKNVATNKTLIPAISFTSGSAANYTITLVSNTTGVITTRAITVTAATNSKVYDGTTAAAATPTITSGSLASGDTAGFTETYATKHVGTGKTLNPAGTVNDGFGGANYAVTFVADTTGVITTRAITVTAATNSKAYDGTTSAAATPTVTSGTLAPGDTNAFSETYDTGAIGTGKTLTPSGVVNDGNGGADYAVTFVNNTTGVITTRAITVTAATNSKAYDGTTTSSGTPTITAGTLAAGDTVTLTQTFDSKNVGSNRVITPAISFTSGSASNYTITLATKTNQTITPRAITVTAATNTKVYDGTTSASASPTITSGSLIGPDTGSFTESYSSAGPGTGKTLVPAGSVTDGNGGANYAITFVNNTTGVISQRPLTITATGIDKVYDGTTTAAVTLDSDALAGDHVNLHLGAANFADKHVGTGKTVTVTGLSINGPDAGNYSLVSTSTTTMARITARAITVTATANTKVYDGTTSAAAIPTITSGSLAPGDTGTFTETYATAGAGTGKTLTPTGSVTDGNSGANYAITFTSTTNGIIDQASSTTVVTCPASVTYDGTAQQPCSAVVTGAGGLNSPVGVTYLNNTAAGTATASATYPGDADHTTSSDSRTFTIDQASSTTVVTCPASVTYDGTAQQPCSAVVTGAGGLNSPVGVTYLNNTAAGTATASATYPGDADHTTSSDSRTFTIDQASSTTVVTCPASVTYDGTAQQPCSAVVTGAGGLNSPVGVTYLNNTAAGTATASATYPGDADHTTSSDSRTFTIDQASSTTVVTCPASVTYDGTAQQPCSAVVTGAGGLNSPVGVTYLNNTAAGTATASATYPGDADHTTSSDSRTFTIDQASSTTVVTCPASVTYDGTAQQPCSAVVTGAGGLNSPVGVTYLNNTAAGTATASATYPGDADHTTSSDSRTFTIDQASSTTVVTCPASVTYDGTAQQPCSAVVTGAGGLNSPVGVTYLNNTAAGTATASATYPGDADHTTSSDSRTFTIDQASSTTVVTCPASVTYDGTAQQPCSAVVTGAGGLNSPVGVTYLNNTAAGTATASATYPGDADHTTSSDSRTFTIDQASSTTVVTCPASVTYDGTAQQPCSAVVTGAGGLNSPVGVTYLNNTAAGTATASATYPGDADHTTSSDSRTFTIDQASSTTVVTCPASVTYDGTAQQPCSAVVTGAGGLNSPVGVTYLNNTAAGTATASATYPGDADHTTSSDSRTFTIDQASSTTVVTCPASVTYDGTAQQPCSAVVTGAGGLNSPVGVTYLNNTAAGTATASATYPGDADHTTSSDSRTFTIDQASSTTVVTCPASVTYDGTAQQPCSAVVTGAGGLNSPVGVTYLNNTAAGTATASATYPGDADHTTSSDSRTFTIDQASSTTVVTCPASVTYDGTAQQPCSAVVTGAGGLNSPVGVTYLNNTAAGTATASATYPGDADHTTSSDSRTFTIDQASSTTVVTCPASVTYDGTAQQPCSAVVTGAGGLNSPVGVTYLNNTAAGTATASATYPGDADHTTSSDSRTFTIDQASSTTVVTCPASVTYDGTAQQPCSAVVTGAGGLNSPVGVTYLNNTAAGTATASATYPGDADHTTSSDSRTFTIDQRALTITAHGVNKVYDGTNLATVSLTDDRVSGDAFSDTYGSATFGDKNVGTGKTVSVSGLSICGADAGNYTFNTTATTTANITARALTITATGVNKVYDGTNLATVSLTDDRVSGDAFSDTYGSATFSDKNVGTGKTVNVSGLTHLAAPTPATTPSTRPRPRRRTSRREP